MAVATVSARPSSMGSPRPTKPSSVWTLRKSQRGFTRKVSSLVIFMTEPAFQRLFGDGWEYRYSLPRSRRIAQTRSEISQGGKRMRLPKMQLDEAREALKTVVAIPVTPFTRDGEVDHGLYTSLTGRMVGGGIRVVTPNGNTSEFYSLT